MATSPRLFLGLARNPENEELSYEYTQSGCHRFRGGYAPGV